MHNVKFISKSEVIVDGHSSDVHDRHHQPTNCLHYHDFYELFVPFGTGGSVELNGQRRRVEQGEVVLVDIFAPHMLASWVPPGDAWFVAHVNAETLLSFGTPGASLVDLFRAPKGGSGVCRLTEGHFEMVSKLFLDYQQAKDQEGGDILCKAILHQMLAYAYCDCAVRGSLSSTAALHLRAINHLIGYIDLHLAEPMMLAQMAAEVNYSEYYICHLFKAYTGRNLTAYIIDKRVANAVALLQQNVPAAKAAELSGFGSYSYFFKVFKKHRGISPTDYRQSAQIQGMTPGKTHKK